MQRRLKHRLSCEFSLICRSAKVCLRLHAEHHTIADWCALSNVIELTLTTLIAIVVINVDCMQRDFADFVDFQIRFVWATFTGPCRCGKYFNVLKSGSARRREKWSGRSSTLNKPQISPSYWHIINDHLSKSRRAIRTHHNVSSMEMRYHS